MRESLHLTQADLGEKAGLSYRTVHDLELGKRQRVQEKTLMLLAQAMDVSLEDLLGHLHGSPETCGDPRGEVHPESRHPALRRLGLVAAALAVLLTGGGIFARGLALRHADFTVDGHTLTVRDALLGIRLWGIADPPGVNRCRLAPWSSSTLLVSLTGTTPDGQNILALDRATGDTLWIAHPDLGAVRAAFGAEVFDGGNLSGSRLIPADLDGDGEPEIIAGFTHSSNYPFILCWIGRDGRIRGQYANHGHFNDLVAIDLDGDGKDELIASGTNNARVYAGATVAILDETHFLGASVDSFSHPASAEPDSALVRLVVPNFPDPFMQGLKSLRFHARNLHVHSAQDGRCDISVEFGPNQNMIGILHLDERLEPRGVVLKDNFLENMHGLFPDSLIAGTGPADPDWLAAWLAGYHRFEAGNRPPAGP